MLGIGYVVVRSGHGSGLAVSIGGIYDSDEFADTIRAQLGSHTNEATDSVETDAIPVRS